MPRVVILLTCFGLALAASESGHRILGGEDTTIEEYPFVANLQQALNGHLWTHFCSGTILTRFVVLTAAACVDGYPAFLWRVALGSSFPTVPAGGTIHPILRFTIHPHFNAPLMDNNVALLHLLIPAEYSTSIQPARIPGPRHFLPDGTTLTALGWGSFVQDGLFPNTLRRVTLELLHQGICWTRYWGYAGAPRISDGMLCAGLENQGGKGTCDRDDGGPLVYDGDLVVGFASWHRGCGSDLMYPSVFTRVSRYSDWIVANANE